MESVAPGVSPHSPDVWGFPWLGTFAWQRVLTIELNMSMTCVQHYVGCVSKYLCLYSF